MHECHVYHSRSVSNSDEVSFANIQLSQKYVFESLLTNENLLAFAVHMYIQLQQSPEEKTFYANS
jgi:hypothetical protein